LTILDVKKNVLQYISPSNKVLPHHLINIIFKVVNKLNLHQQEN